MQKEEVIIIGGGPCGMSCAIELQNIGMKPLIIEKGNVANTIYHFPTHQTFFSSSHNLEIGGIPFINERQKPVRIQALAYYREVAKRTELNMNTFEKVTHIKKNVDSFVVTTKKRNGKEKMYQARYVVVATGYYDQPHYMNVPGEDLPKVSHYFKEGHPYYDKNVVIIGGKNSAVDAALELHNAGASITVLYRGHDYSSSIKPWILPDFASLVRKGIIRMEFNAHITKITDSSVYYEQAGVEYEVKNDFVFAMTGYRPDMTLLSHAGVTINHKTGKPLYDELTFETNVEDLYVAGVVASGNNNNEIFIENGRFHGAGIAKSIKEKQSIKN
ncbi:MAG TPA: YpdA family putative bacillithiol disulfide reductase [Cerasibacillus sp.]|uniref:YpdA family putative bacillithiol disulfide reductase n=1 Tax=Cerasibacillus sp. TaxID=2498711 RepID=UPI002F3F4468